MKRARKAAALLMALVMAASFWALPVGAQNPEEAGLLPIRALFEEAGATVQWQSGEILIEFEGGLIALPAGRPVAYVNGEPVALQVGAVVWGGRSFISEADLAAIFAVPISVEILTEIAYEVIERFATGDIAGMFSMMSAAFQQVVGFETLIEVFQTILVSQGSFVEWSNSGITVEEAWVTFYFEVVNTIGSSIYRVDVTPIGEVGTFIAGPFVFMPIPVGEDAGFTAEAVVVGENTLWPLDGILTMPHGASEESPVPAVVLVHGSGAHNMDSSIFDNRPFGDIATYLSSNGIAVLRYHKRAFSHPAAPHPTIWEETVEDALFAARILQGDPRVCSVFVLGLSLGGMLAPRIAEEGQLDGAILFGAPARPLYEVQFDQNLLFITQALEAGLISEEDAEGLLAMVQSMLMQAMGIPYMSEEEMQDMLVFGIPAIMHRSVVDSLPIPYIAGNTIPTLILHGTRDWQVTVENDFSLFLEVEGEFGHVTAILYEGVNHIFMMSQTTYDDWRDYMPPGSVYEGLLRDIVEWIMNITR